MSEVDLALSYAAAGIPVFPCRPCDVVTNEYDRETGEIIIHKAKTPLVSNGFKGATLRERNIRILWERNPGAMVGIPTGEPTGAWVLDIDVHKDDEGNVIDGYAAVQALEAEHGPLPATATAKTAGGGEHRYFRHVPGVRNRGRLGAGLDVRGGGGYVIAPGSKTAEGGEYYWVDHDGPGIPEIADAPEWLLALVLPKPAPAVVSEYSYAPGDNSLYVERAVSDELHKLATTQQGGRGEQVNTSAFCLGTLVGAGVLDRAEAEAGLLDAAYSNGVVAKDGEREIRAKIRRGMGAGMKHPRAIPEREIHSDTTPLVDTTTLLAKKREQAAAPAAAPSEPEPDETDPPEYLLEAVDDLESLTYPGGLVEELVDWIVSSSEQPCRALALAAALPLVASLAGNRYSTGARDTRPNIYVVALAESGFGKEHARSQVKRLFMGGRGVFEDYGGPARIMSASALREVLEKTPSVNCQIDEFGGFVRDITDRKAGSHQRAISTDLRDYYSASSTFFEGAAYRGSPPKRIYNPNLCIHGTSTPEQFWSALSSASAEDGLLPRLILFHVTGDKPSVITPQYPVSYVPDGLLQQMADVAGIDPVAKRNILREASKKGASEWIESKPRIVQWTPDAEEKLAAVKKAIEDRENKVAVEGRPFVRRIVENAIKLALIAAVGINPTHPRIDDQTFEWAAAVAWTCAASMLAQVNERLSDNQREANYKRIAALVRQAGAKGITKGRLADRLKSIESRQREEIIKDLQEAGRITIGPNDNAKGRPTQRLLWVM